MDAARKEKKRKEWRSANHLWPKFVLRVTAATDRQGAAAGVARAAKHGGRIEEPPKCDEVDRGQTVKMGKIERAEPAAKFQLSCGEVHQRREQTQNIAHCRLQIAGSIIARQPKACRWNNIADAGICIPILENR